MRRLGIAVALLATAAFGEVPTVVLAPVTVEGLELSPDEARTAGERALLAAGVVTSDSALTAAALQPLAGKDCRADDACLAALAARAKALYAVQVTLRGDGSTLTAEGHVVRDDGPKVAGPKTATVSRMGKETKAAAREALAEVYKALDMAKLPTTRVALAPSPTVAAAPAPTSPAAPVDVVKPAASAPSGGAGVPVLIAGAVVAAAGVGIAVGSQVAWSAVAEVVGQPPFAMPKGPDFGANGAKAQSAELWRTVGVAVAGGGAAVAVVGAILLATAKPSGAAVSLGVAPLPGGAAVGLSGPLP